MKLKSHSSIEKSYEDIINDKYSWHKGYFQKTMGDNSIWVQNRNELEQRDIALNTLGELNGKDILDVGCGQGMYVLTFLKMRAKSVAGIDISENYIKIAKGYVRENGYTADLRVADCTKMPFEDSSFDKVFSGDVFEHITKEQKASCLEEIYRVLRPGGVCTIKTPNLKYQKMTLFLRRVRAILRLKNPFNIYIAHTKNNPDCEHHGLTDHKELMRIMRSANFSNIEITYVPLKRTGVPHLFSRLFKKVLLFNESVILTIQKPIFISLYN